MENILVIGAGSVGVNAALFLDKLGHQVTLLDHADDILTGAAEVTCVNHGDGFEYYKKGNKLTGFYCIDGSLTKALLYPLHTIQTNICDANNPIRFYLSQGSVNSSEISISEFHDNVQDMWKHFTHKYRFIKRSKGWSDDDAEQCFLRRPETFCRKFELRDCPDVSGMAAAYAGSSFGVNMAYYYALLKAALRKSGVTCKFGLDTEKIEKVPKGYVVHSGGFTFHANHILLCAGHQIPSLTKKISHVTCTRNFIGTYYLNMMTFINLPPTRSEKMLEYTRRINFTLQQDHGGMYACLVSPTNTSPGYAAIYYPSSKGSQRKRHPYTLNSRNETPFEWDSLMTKGVHNSDPKVLKTLDQVSTLYPFLRDYAKIDRTECRPVFNPATSDNKDGRDRKIRVPAANGGITDDMRISAWTAPKWTNAELVAFIAVDYVLNQLKSKGLPKNDPAGCGPTSLDVAEITNNLCFRDLNFEYGDALYYTKRSGFPVNILDKAIKFD